MTLPLLRNRRTTARRITPPTLAASAAALVALFAVPGFAQPPASQPGQLPVPPGYRQRTAPPPARPPAPTHGGGGTVMYFQKPADALTATGGPGSSAEGTAQLRQPARGPVGGVPDAQHTTAPVPLPPASRYAPPPAAVRVAVPPSPAAYTTQPEVQPLPSMASLQPGDTASTSQKKQEPIKPVPEQYIKLPQREFIFMVYDDAELERAIMDRIIDDRIKELRDLIEVQKAAGQDTKDTERRLEEQVALKKNPSRDAQYRFPDLPQITPPGTQYHAKTINYPPRQELLEPGYVVHRRLHFEERNSERYGWDLGPVQTLVSTAYFCRDVLAWPQSLASGCVYGFWGTSAGKCMPGSPVPYYLYPPNLTVTGTVVEGIAITGTAFILP